MVARLKPHPFRDLLAQELHARPSAPIHAPALATRIVMMVGENAAEESVAHLAGLCRAHGLPVPDAHASYHALELAGCSLRFERHTELAAYTVLRPVAEDAALFSQTAAEALPEDWRTSLPGELLIGIHAHVALEAGAAGDMFAAAFGEGVFAAARLGEAGAMASDYRLYDDGFERLALLVRPGTAPALTGRLLQAALEAATYRMAALIAFPVAQDTRRRLGGLEAELSQTMERLAAGDEDDRALLDRITGLAARCERLADATSYRFAAARAYDRLVQERIEALGETPLPERPTTGAFMARRLAPAMRTCEAVTARQTALLARIGRATDLLATRVQVKAEEQNAALLASMDKRSQLQLRLQEAVEGLSTVAISYYALGIVAYLAKAAEHAGAPIDAQTAIGLAAAPVVIGVFLFLRRLRRSMGHDGKH